MSNRRESLKAFSVCVVLTQFFGSSTHINPSLNAISIVLEALKLPPLPPVFHIAGTNGKGSTLAFMKSVLTTHGYRVHRYTSPHLVKWEERVEILGEPVETQTFQETLTFVKDLSTSLDATLTLFEALTIVALILFSKTPADFTLWETGLGGRWDATNVIQDPLVSIISSISLDHTEFLGLTLELIAKEKAGIMRPYIPVVCAHQEESVQKVLIEEAKKKDAPISFLSKNLTKEHILSLSGEHQHENAALAIAALRAANLPLRKGLIDKGLSHAIWPGRLETRDGILFDGAHNVGGARVLCAYLLEQNYPYTGVIGMKRRKDLEGFLILLKPALGEIVSIDAGDDSYDPKEIMDMGNKIGIPSRQASSLKEAVALSKHAVIVCGSLEIMGEKK